MPILELLPFFFILSNFQTFNTFINVRKIRRDSQVWPIQSHMHHWEQDIQIKIHNTENQKMSNTESCQLLNLLPSPIKKNRSMVVTSQLLASCSYYNHTSLDLAFIIFLLCKGSRTIGTPRGNDTLPKMLSGQIRLHDGNFRGKWNCTMGTFGIN